MIVLNRLHRGDFPRYVPVTAYQTDARLVFRTEFDANLFIEAHRRADSAVSFQMVTVPETSPREFWAACRDADWHYDASDDHGVWCEGGAALGRLQVQACCSDEHRRIYLGWRRHYFTGPAYGNERRPAPEEPLSDRDGSGEAGQTAKQAGPKATARAARHRPVIVAHPVEPNETNRDGI